MIKILAIHEARTEHAKEVRKQTGTNDYRDKAIFFRDSFLMQCIIIAQATTPGVTVFPP